MGYQVKEASKNSTRISQVWAIQKEDTKIEGSVCLLHISAIPAWVFFTGSACVFFSKAFIQLPFLLLYAAFAFPFSQKLGPLSKFQGIRHEFLFYWIFCLMYLNSVFVQDELAQRCRIFRRNTLWNKSISFTIMWLLNLYYINENFHGKKPHSNVRRIPFNWICQASLQGICLEIRAVCSPSCQMILS